MTLLTITAWPFVLIGLVLSIAVSGYFKIKEMHSSKNISNID